MIDDIDRKILVLLGQNARISNSEIAKQIVMTPPGVLDRIRKLEKRGVIKGYETRIDTKKVDLGMTVLIMVQTSENVGINEVGEALAKLSRVQEVYYLTGEFCYMLKVRVSNTDDLTLFLEQVGKIKNVRDTRTTLVLKTIKETLELDL